MPTEKRSKIVTTNEFVVIREQVYPVDTERQIARARIALRDAGLQEVLIWHGDSSCPDSFEDRGLKLFVD